MNGMEEIKKMEVEYTTEQILERVKELGHEISRDYEGKDLILVGVLKGSLYFFADLTREIDIQIQLDFISIGVYPHTTNETGVVRIVKDLDVDITGKHVIVIEDIIRTGLTIGYLVQNLESRRPASVKVCSLFVNPAQQLINVPISYYGFEISDTWLMGYGMDVKEFGRNLPYIVKTAKK